MAQKDNNSDNNNDNHTRNPAAEDPNHVVATAGIGLLGHTEDDWNRQVQPPFLCLVCRVPVGRGGSSCAGCSMVRYCSSTCQQRHWRNGAGHRAQWCGGVRGVLTIHHMELRNAAVLYQLFGMCLDCGVANTSWCERCRGGGSICNQCEEVEHFLFCRTCRASA